MGRVNRISMQNIEPCTLSSSNININSMSDNIFTDSINENEEENRKIRIELQEKEELYFKLSNELKRLESLAKAENDVTKKNNKIEKIAGITGAAIGGIGIGSMIIFGTGLLKTVGLGLTLCCALPMAAIGAGIIGGVVAASAGFILSQKGKNNIEENISNIQEQLKVLEREIAILKQNLNR